MEEEQTSQVEEQDQFPPEVADAVDGLLWLGYLEDEFAFCGHRFVIRTLKAEEELMAAKLTEEYQNVGQPKAFSWAHVALSIVSLDGDTEFCPPLGPDGLTNAKAKFRYVTRWFPPVGEFIFARYAALVEKQSRALEEMENLSQRSLHSYERLVDSSNEPENSEEV